MYLEPVSMYQCPAALVAWLVAWDVTWLVFINCAMSLEVRLASIDHSWCAVRDKIDEML